MKIKIMILCFIFLGQAAIAKSFLIVGDSLTCGPFGKYLTQELAKQGNSVTLYCAVSSAPANWMNGKNPAGQNCQTLTSADPVLKPCGDQGQIPKFESILAKYKNSEVIVALGTNSLMSAKVDSSYKAMVKATQANGNSCKWIGPPHANPSQSKGFPAGRVATLEKNLNSFYDSLSAQVDSGCRLIDSRDATASGTVGNQTVDGIHRSDAAGKEWIRQISSQVTGTAKESVTPSGATK